MEPLMITPEAGEGPSTDIELRSHNENTDLESCMQPDDGGKTEVNDGEVNADGEVNESTELDSFMQHDEGEGIEATSSSSPNKMMETMKLVIPLVLFHIILPSVDTGTDLNLIINWYRLGSYKFASSMLVPFVLSYCAQWYTFLTIKSQEHKKYTWMFALLNVWPQFRSVKLIFSAFTDIKSAQKKKKHLLCEISGLEPFLESIPSIFIMTMCWIVSTNNPKEQFEDLFGDHGVFWSTYVISIFAGTFGVTSFLINGPCNIMSSEEGALGGILTGRFVVAFLAIGCSIMSKVWFAVFLIYSYTYTDYDYQFKNLRLIEILAMFFGLDVLPHLILAFIGIALGTWFNKKGLTQFFKLILRYPALILISVFTFLTIGPRSLACCAERQQNPQSWQLSISKNFVVVNIVMSVVLYVTMVSISTKGFSSEPTTELISLIIFVPLLAMGILFTAILVWGLERCVCCGPTCYKLEHRHININPDNNEIQVQVKSTN